MSATSTIQLTTLPQVHGTGSQPAPGIESSGIVQRRHEQSSEDVLQESANADSDVPDGGYGWVVIASGAVLFWWSVGTTYTWGVMQAALAEEGLASPAVLSFIGSLQAALVSALALINSRLMRRIGAKSASLLSVVFMGGSEILASFSTKNIGGLFFTSGFLMGVGVG